MNELIEQNTKEKVHFWEKILIVQNELQKRIEDDIMLIITIGLDKVRGA